MLPSAMHRLQTAHTHSHRDINHTCCIVRYTLCACALAHCVRYLQMCLMCDQSVHCRRPRTELTSAPLQLNSSTVSLLPATRSASSYFATLYYHDVMNESVCFNSMWEPAYTTTLGCFSVRNIVLHLFLSAMIFLNSQLSS